MFKQLGMEWVLSDLLFQSLQEITCKLYCFQPGTDNINELRYRLFCVKKGNIDSAQLPPCVDCLFKHAAHANFQAATWKRSLQSCQGTRPLLLLAGAKTVITLPLTGWAVTQPLQPLLELLTCSCTRPCQLPTCSCLENGSKCTDVYKLLDCDNRCEDSIEEFVSDDSEEDEEI